MAGRLFNIEAAWDREERGWLITSPDIPGLVLGAFNDKQVVEKVKRFAPAMIETGVEPEDVFTIRFTGKAYMSHPAEIAVKLAA